MIFVTNNLGKRPLLIFRTLEPNEKDRRGNAVIFNYIGECLHDYLYSILYF